MQRTIAAALAIFLAGSAAGCAGGDEATDGLPEVDIQGGGLPEIDAEPTAFQITTDTQNVRLPEGEVAD